MKRLPLLLAALLVAIAAIVSAAPTPARTVAPKIFGPHCPPGKVSTGPPLCRCVGGEN
jgi:hypothetical protein